jgi:undecaprenyl-diphosphatase
LLFCALLSTAATRSRNNRLDAFVETRVGDYALRHAAAVRAARIVTFFGSTLCLTAVVIVAALLFFLRRRPGAAIQLIVVGLLSSAVVNVIKALVARPRPTGSASVHAVGYAFPSGHATNSTAVYGMLTMLILSNLPSPRRRRLLGLLTAAMVIVIAASRVVLGVHWFTDVVAGIALGVSIDTVAWFFRRRYRTLPWRPRRGDKLPKTSALM